MNDGKLNFLSLVCRTYITRLILISNSKDLIPKDNRMIHEKFHYKCDYLLKKKSNKKNPGSWILETNYYRITLQIQIDLQPWILYVMYGTPMIYLSTCSPKNVPNPENLENSNSFVGVLVHNYFTCTGKFIHIVSQQRSYNI